MGKSPLRVESAAKTGFAAPAADTVEISGSEPVYPYTAMYGPPTMAQETGTPVKFMGATTESSPEEGKGKDAEAAASASDESSTGDEKRQIQELKQRDQEVRQHEQAHKSVGGRYAGSMSFEYQQGPDGRRYAVGGEVSIDLSEERDPSATAAKMRQVRAAALAPASPSAQDMSVAAQASQLETEARQKASEQRMAETSGENGGAGASTTGMGAAESGAASRPGAMSGGEGGQSAGAISGARQVGPASGASASTARLSSSTADTPFATQSPAAQGGLIGGVRSRIDIVA